MKTMILSDDVYARLMRALESTPEGRAVVGSFGRSPALPSDRELVRLARAKEPPPEAIRLAREHRDAGRQAATDTREALEQLMHHAHDAGVPAVALSRWFGLTLPRVYQVLDLKPKRQKAA